METYIKAVHHSPPPSLQNAHILVGFGPVFFFQFSLINQNFDPYGQLYCATIPCLLSSNRLKFGGGSNNVQSWVAAGGEEEHSALSVLLMINGDLDLPPPPPSSPLPNE